MGRAEDFLFCVLVLIYFHFSIVFVVRNAIIQTREISKIEYCRIDRMTRYSLLLVSILQIKSYPKVHHIYSSKSIGLIKSSEKSLSFSTPLTSWSNRGISTT